MSDNQKTLTKPFRVALALSFVSLIFPAAAAVVTPAPGTSLVTVSYSGTPSQVDNYFVYHVLDTNGIIHEGATALGNLLPGVTPNPATFPLPYTVFDGYASIFGIYSLTSLTTGLASVAMSPAYGTAAVGQPFSSVFTGMTEDALVTSLINGNTASLISFLNANSVGVFRGFTGDGTPIGVSNIHFSNGAAAGTFGITVLSGTSGSVTPEPSAFLLAGPALVFLIRRKRSAASTSPFTGATT